MKHQIYHCNVDQSFTAFCKFFVVLAHSPISSQPAECTLDHPAVGQDFEACQIVSSFNYFQHPTTQLLGPLNQLASIPAIGPNEFQARAFSLHGLQQQFRAISILNVRRMNDDCDQQPQSIYCKVPFASLYFLSRVIAANPFFSVVFTDWLSMIAALGLHFRPASLRTSSRSES